MSLLQQLSELTLEQRVVQYHQTLISQKPNYYDMMELSKTATIRDIESALQLFSNLFPQDQVSNIRDEPTRDKANFILNKFHRATIALSDFSKRSEYEKRGFREPDEMEAVVDEPIERAKLFYRKAKSLHSQRDFNSAIRVLKEAIVMDPNTPAYHFLLGLCQAEIPIMIQDAEKSMLKSAEMETWNAEPLVALGMLFYKERLPNRAETYFRKALAIEPGHSVAKRKLEEIVGPPKSQLMQSLNQGSTAVKGALGKIFPSFFGDKKK